PISPLAFAAIALTLHAVATEPVAQAQSPVFGDPVNVSNNTDDSNQPAVAVDGTNVYVVWFDYKESTDQTNIMFKASADKGKTFGSAKNLSNLADPLFKVRFPSVAAAGGKVYVAWHTTKSGFDTIEGIYIAVSNDGGSSFGSATKLSTSSSDYSHTDARVTVSGSNVFVIWERFDTSAASGFLYFANMMFRRSTDSGGSFEAEQNLSGYTSSDLDGRWPRLAASGSNVYVAWTEKGTTDKLRFKKSSDSGESFPIIQSFDPVGYAPALTASGSNVYLAWSRGFQRSSESGATFQSGPTLDSSSLQNAYEIAAEGDMVYVAWADVNRTDLNLIASLDGGATFSTKVDISGASDPGNTQQPHTISIAASARGPLVVWSDKNGEIMLRGPGTPKPVVFVPGIAGSQLVDRNSDDEVLWVDPAAVLLRKLSLFPRHDPNVRDVLAPDVLRFDPHAGDIYGSFMQMLANNGYHEYDVKDSSGRFDPFRRSSGGCDTSQANEDPKPNLFVFAYDWRQDNVANASLLRAYIECVRQIHPATDVTVLTHSMGSLLARRYVLDHPADHHVNKMITIGAPWLGAPKLAYTLETGLFVENLMFFPPGREAIKELIGSFHGAHQLITSRAYIELGAQAPIREGGRDLDGNDRTSDIFNYDAMVALVNVLYGEPPMFNPGTTSKNFHQGGQDDWRNDTSGVSYYHILGVKPGETTIESMVARYETQCSQLAGTCSRTPTAEPTFTLGDGTVPFISAIRRGAGRDYNAPNTPIERITVLVADQEDMADHNHMLQNPQVHDKVLEWLSAPLQSVGGSQASSAQGVEATQEPDPLPYYYVKVIGADSLTVSDSLGNDTGGVDDAFNGIVPGVDTFVLGRGVTMVTIPTTATPEYATLFDSTGDPVSIEVRIGTGHTTTRSIRYQDIVLPAGVSTRLSFTISGPQDLAYDSDGNGTFDTTVQPTVDVTGAQAEDTDPPMIDVEEELHGGSSRITLSAEDPAGVARLLYSLDGTNYQEYTGPLTLVSQRTPVLYAFADDNLANRGTLVHELRKNATPIPAITWWGMLGLVVLVVGAGYLRLRGSRAAVGRGSVH
ncbi:MAG: alpha/beta fold hydrolase, partial [Chloroflexi bacterium]|nr:alpha/beta fold hydrolase [Chloroflexota bacterium]